METILIRAIEIEEEFHIKNNDSGMFKGLATWLIEGINELIVLDFIPYEDIIHLSYKISLLVIPDHLSLTVPKYKLEKVQNESIYGYMLDYEYYLFLHEILALSVKLSIIGEKINQADQWDKIIADIWSVILQKQNIKIIHSFLIYAWFKLSGRSYSSSSSENKKILDISNRIIDHISKNLYEMFTENDFNMVIDKAMDPVMLFLSKLVIEKYTTKEVIQNWFDKFEYSQELHRYITSIFGDVVKVDDLFDSQPLMIDDNDNYRTFEYARDFQDFENSLKTEAKSTLFELLSESKNELEYLSRHFVVIMEKSLILVERFYSEQGELLLKDEETVPKLITMIMVLLYNYRHFNKVMEEKTQTKIEISSLSRLKHIKYEVDSENSLVLQRFINFEKLNDSTIESASNIFSVLNTSEFISKSYMFPIFTKTIIKMLHSTSIACPHLSVSILQCWFPLMSNLISASMKNKADLTKLLCFNASRENCYINMMEALMLAFKRISITKSFEITQIRVYIQCLIRIIRLKSDMIDYAKQIDDETIWRNLINDYMYWSNMIFWVWISCIQSIIVSTSHKSVRSIINIGLTSLTALLSEERFRDFLCNTERFSKNFENYSVFSTEKSKSKMSRFSNQSNFEGHYIWFYDLLFKCVELGECPEELDYLLTIEITDQSILHYDSEENAFLRILIMILLKMYKIDVINKDKEYSYKLKFSKWLKHIKALEGMMPEIDEFNRLEMDSCLNDLKEILSNFYAGDELPFMAIWELLSKLAGFLTKFLHVNQHQSIIKKVIHTIETFWKVRKLNHEWYNTLIQWIKIQAHKLAVASSTETGVSCKYVIIFSLLIISRVTHLKILKKKRLKCKFA